MGYETLCKNKNAKENRVKHAHFKRHGNAIEKESYPVGKGICTFFYMTIEWRRCPGINYKSIFYKLENMLMEFWE